MQLDVVADGRGDMPDFYRHSFDGSELLMEGGMVTRRYGWIEEAVSFPS
jgi:hypothetical protein